MMMGNVNSRQEAIIQFAALGENNQQLGEELLIAVCSRMRYRQGA